MTDLDRMRLHVEALFTHDFEGDLVRVNEPGGLPAPRFFLGRTVGGAVCRFRHDVDRELRAELEAAVADEVLGADVLDSPLDPSPYQRILARRTPVERTWLGPAFSFPDTVPTAIGTVLVTEANARVLHPHFEAWTTDVGVCDPMAARLIDGQAVSLCGSVRRISAAHEAGVETAAGFRGRGHASQAVAAWAQAVREMNRVPLYSTSWQNEASRALAGKMALLPFGNDLHIT